MAIDTWRQTETLTILAGQQNSEELSFTGNNARTKVLIQIMVPSAVTEILNLQVAEAPGGSYVIQRSGGVVMAYNGGFADQAGPILAGAIRLRATTAVGANRTVNVIVEPYAV